MEPWTLRIPPSLSVLRQCSLKVATWLCRLIACYGLWAIILPRYPFIHDLIKHSGVEVKQFEWQIQDLNYQSRALHPSRIDIPAC